MTDCVFIVCISVVVILTIGEPDIIDGIVFSLGVRS